MINSQGFAVVGLHRGGTSAVAGVLFHLGVYMGKDLLPPSQHNPRGYFEDKRIVELHTDMMGQNWAHPNFLDGMSRLNYGLHALEYLELLEEWQEHELWAVKDPRLCYLLHHMPATIPFTKVIAVFRDPWSAARSLFKRGGHTEEEALAISLDYCKAMFRNVPDSAFWVHYNDLIESPTEIVTKIAEFVGTEVTQEAIDFVDPELRHWR